MNREDTLEQFDSLAMAIREPLLREWDACRHDHPAATGIHDDDVPAPRRLGSESQSNDGATNIGQITAHLNFVAKNYVGRIPDKILSQAFTGEIFALTAAAMLPSRPLEPDSNMRYRYQEISAW